MRYKPFGRDDLAFPMLVPKRWKDVPVKVSREQFAASLLQWRNADEGKEAYEKDLRQGVQRLAQITLADIKAPKEENGPPAIEVTGVRIPYEINIRDWAEGPAHLLKWEILLSREGSYNGRRV